MSLGVAHWYDGVGHEIISGFGRCNPKVLYVTEVILYL